jgi:hypothetical protein
MVYLILKILSGILGFLLLYVAVFYYEDEDGKLQSGLETLWLRMSDLQESMLGRHVIFLNVIAQSMTSVFDLLFGEKLWSIRSIGVSICYALGCLRFAMAVVAFRHGTEGGASVGEDLFASLFWFAYGTITVLIRQKIWHQTWAGVLVVFLIAWTVLPWLYMAMYLQNQPARVVLLPLSILEAGTLMVGFFCLSILVVRFTLLKVGHTTSLWKVVVLALLNGVPLGILYLLFYRLEHWIQIVSHNSDNVFWHHVNMTWVLMLVFSLAIGSPIVISAAVFIILALILLLHRALWPTFNRPIYLLQKLGIPKRKKLFVTLGVLLIGYAIGRHEWLKDLISSLV